MAEGDVTGAGAAGDRFLNCGFDRSCGFELAEDDRIRARVIELLMCDFAFDFATIRHEFGGAAESVLDDAEYLAQADTDGMVEFSKGLFQITDKGRPFVRSIASAFDAYFGVGTATVEAIRSNTAAVSNEAPAAMR